MYALTPFTSTAPKRTTPNLLPCTIHHNGPITTTSRYWCPSTDSDNNNTKTSYFRGRKLHGRTVKLPSGYTGLVIQKTDNVLPVKPKMPTVEELRAMEEGDEMGDVVGGLRAEEVEVKMLEQKGEFEEVVVWGHETLPETDDVYARGVEEWIGFAEAMHCDDEPIATKANGAT